MLALYHNITVRKRRVLKQRLQIQQRTAADRGHGRQAHTAAGHRIEHPLRNLQEPHSWVLIDAAPEHTSPILGQSFVDRYSAGVPRMPRVTDFSPFNIMGVALSTRTTRGARIPASDRASPIRGRLPDGQALRTAPSDRPPHCGRSHSGWAASRVPIGETCGVSLLAENTVEKISWAVME